MSHHRWNARQVRFGPASSRQAKLLLLAGVAVAFLGVDVLTASAQVSEVVVTARKREENVQNIPVAVTALSGQQIQKYNLSDVESVATQTPELVIDRGSSGSGANITLRGIGSSSENIGIEQSVAVNVDGVYYGQGRVIDEGIFDTSAVQILKGPQALFYGKNASAGAIAIQTNDPGPNPEASLTAGYEFNAEEPYVEGVVSGPVTTDFGLRLAFHVSDQQNGYLKQTAPAGVYNTFDAYTGHFNSSPTANPPSYLGGDDDDLVRLTGKWKATDRLTVTLKGTFDRHTSNNNADNTVNVYCPLGFPQSEATQSFHSTCGKSFQAPQPALPLAIADIPNTIFSKEGGQDFEHYQDENLFLRINYSGDNYTLTSTTAAQHLFNDWADNQNFSAAPSVYASEHFKWNQLSTEERGNTTFKFPINFAGGFYFQTTDLDFNQDVDFAAAQNTDPTIPPQDEYTAYQKLSTTVGHTYAVFGQAIWDVIPNVEITGGARYTHELKNSIFEQPYVNPTLTALFVQYDPADPTTSVRARQQFNNVSPEATITWRATPDLTLYGAYKTGYKSGGFSDSAILSTLTLPSDLQFRPETAEGFEVGEKAILFDHQLRVNVDGFDFLYSNLQVDFFNTPTFNYITLNAASARTYGVEYEVEYAPKAVPGLVLHLDGAYDDSHYGTFEAPCSPAGLTYEQGCNALRVPQANGSYSFTPNCGGATNNCDFMNVSGGPTALSPKFTEVLGADYERNVSSRLKVGLSVNARISSSYVANPFPSGITEQIDRQSGYGMLDAVLSLGTIDGHWQFSVIGRNLTNTFVETSTAGLPLSGGTTGCKTSVCGPQIVSDQAATVENPRTVAIQARYKF